MPDKQIAIIGATGFTGSELVRILYHHPRVKISAITSESRAGESFDRVHPQFADLVSTSLVTADDLDLEHVDLIFLALPHGVSMEYVEALSNSNKPIIDLSGDYRLSSPSVYEQWYGKKHTYTAGFERAVYGLPELNKAEIRTSDLIANPGCYPTSVILAIAPLLSETFAGKLNLPIIADSKSGVTGAGVKSKPLNHFSVVNDNFKAYGLKSHRHSVEIQEKLNELGDSTNAVQFTPHLLPVDRGILSTIYVHPEHFEGNDETLEERYRTFYRHEPFIRIMSSSPSIKHVRGTNFCDIHVTYDDRTGNIIIISAIDNLVKGAAGQAVQNMNLMFGYDEALGLKTIPLSP